jgi:hypothetical protein
MGFDNGHLGTLMPFGAPSTPSFADLSANGSSRTPERPFGRRRNATVAPGATTRKQARTASIRPRAVNTVSLANGSSPPGPSLCRVPLHALSGAWSIMARHEQVVAEVDMHAEVLPAVS